MYSIKFNWIAHAIFLFFYCTGVLHLCWNSVSFQNRVHRLASPKDARVGGHIKNVITPAYQNGISLINPWLTVWAAFWAATLWPYIHSVEFQISQKTRTKRMEMRQFKTRYQLPELNDQAETREQIGRKDKPFSSRSDSLFPDGDRFRQNNNPDRWSRSTSSFMALLLSITS